MIKSDEYFMKRALAWAQKAELVGEVPVGAVVVKDGKIIASGHNRRITDKDAAAHAEIVAIRRAGKRLGTWRLDGCTIYVTLEPCAMCAGALINSRITRLVFGATDARFGCCKSIYNLPADSKFNHTVEICEGVLGEECSSILSGFFQKRRGRNV